VDVDDRSRTLLAAVEALYSRLQSNALTSADLIDLDTLTPPVYNSYLTRIFKDQALFDQQFQTFKVPYDQFRVFGEGETVLDIGAHWGYSALAMFNQGCRASIVSIEAMPFHIPALATLKRLAAGRYDYVHVAASEIAQRLQFYVPVVNRKLVGGLSSTGATLTPHLAIVIGDRADDFPPLSEGAPDEVALAKIEVGALPLDDIVPALGEARQRIGGIKMDIEGHEAAALRGGRQVITSLKPILMVEGGGLAEVRQVMDEYGYIRAARIDGRLVPWDKHPKASDTFWYHPETTEALRNRGLVA
jgi:FkbM family methyltransferase